MAGRLPKMTQKYVFDVFFFYVDNTFAMKSAIMETIISINLFYVDIQNKVQTMLRWTN